MHRPNEPDPFYSKKPGKPSQVAKYEPRKELDAKAMQFDEETRHKTRKYEARYNKLLRKFEYNKVITMVLSFDIR